MAYVNCFEEGGKKLQLLPKDIFLFSFLRLLVEYNAPSGRISRFRHSFQFSGRRTFYKIQIVQIKIPKYS